MKTSSKKKVKLTLLSFAALAFACIHNSPSVVSSNAAAKLVQYTVADELANNGQYGADFNSFEEAEAAADEINRQLCEEGNTLLKNDGTLPLAKGAMVSIFGIAQEKGASTTDSSGSTDKVSLKQSLEDAGYVVNPTLATYYETDSGSTLNETTSFPMTVNNSISLYNDLGVVMFARSGGEGNDLSTNTGEDDIEGEHENNPNGKKHYLELSDSERELLEIAKSRCNKVIVLLNSSYVMEMGNLQDDDGINAILWIGYNGETGMSAVGRFLNGEVNPSGRSVDIWARDFTKDPTWENLGDYSQVGVTDGDIYYYSDGKVAGNSQNGGFGYPGYHGVDYEEGIYLGYKYYETRYKMIADTLSVDQADKWYAENVVYPFGYGNGYSTFSFDIQGVYTDEGLETALGTSVSASQLESYSGHEASIKTLYIPVSVTNTGDVAGKQTVQIYVTAPYTNGEIEKSFVVLTGFGKTSLLQPNQTETVLVSINVQDFASYDYNDANNNGNKGYELDPGEYTIRAMDNSHVELSGDYGTRPYDSASFTLEGTEAVNLKLDDYSGNVVSNKFSSENGIYDSFREGVNVTDEDPMTVLSRKDMGVLEDSDIESFPKAPTKAGKTFTEEFTDRVIEYDVYDADNTGVFTTYDDPTSGKENWADDVNIPDNWTQATTSAELNDILLKDMAGVDLDSEEGSAKWTTFMNQLSWDEIKTVLHNGGYKTAAVSSIGKEQGVDADGPNNLNSTHDWCDEPTIASTFNVELAEKEGIIMANLAMFDGVTGWYGPGANIHRSPFSGRNAQYYSQDGIQGGLIGAAVVKGAESRGLICYMKHFVSNDQETSRDGEVKFVWQTEQALRENQLKQFQIPMQEGNASGAMTAFARIGSVPSSANYNLLTGVTREEWGWKGYYVTDGYNGTERCASLDLMIRTGQDMPLGNLGTSGYPTIMDWDCLLDYNDGDQITVTSPRDVSGEWDSTLRNGKGGVVVGGVELETYTKTGLHTYDIQTVTTDEVESEAQWYFARMCAMRILYNNANSICNKNGVSTDNYVGGDLGSVTQGASAQNISVAASESVTNGLSANYAITSGSLPDGMSLNASTGAISGSATGATGTYEFTVQASISSWVTCSATYTLTVESAFNWDGDDLTGAKVGQEFSGYVGSDTIKDNITGEMASPGGETIQLGTTVTYGIKDGTSLPDGLTIASDGLIEGTPTTAGTYNFTIDVTATTTGWGGSGSSVHYYYDMTIVVSSSESGSGDSGSGDTTTDNYATKDDISSLEEKISSTEDSIDALTEAIENLDTTPTTTTSNNALAVTAIVISSISLVAAAGFVCLTLLKKK